MTSSYKQENWLKGIFFFSWSMGYAVSLRDMKSGALRSTKRPQKREQGTLDMGEQEERIDNLWIRIDLIFDFWRCLIERLYILIFFWVKLI
ncbi:hypothetical protein [Okeania sp.]|uniref:hypothetical protein n=1 Tax=Okeania sp. TaxID=3100323 RepID=UPI002B4B8D29|nr:hypothetical protein [Okeania sp.]MEB3343032.1 hypothetical protein [Okeania sp.]